MAATAGQRLSAWVREDFGVDLTSIDGVGHGVDEAAELWRGVSVDGGRYAVKLSGGGTPAGLVVSAHLADHRVPGVAGRFRPVPAACGAYARAVDLPLCHGCRTTARWAVG